MCNVKHLYYLFTVTTLETFVRTTATAVSHPPPVQALF